MAKGIVKWFNPDKGFGFIAQENGPDVYFNQYALKGIKNLDIKNVKSGSHIEFEISSDPARTKAYTISSID